MYEGGKGLWEPRRVVDVTYPTPSEYNSSVLQSYHSGGGSDNNEKPQILELAAKELV